MTGEAEVARMFAAMEGVDASPSMFGDGPGWWVNGKEIAHLEGGVLDLRLTRDEIRSRRDELRADDRITLRSGTSDWIDVSVVDLALVTRLAEVAAAVHRAPQGVTPKAPPTGRELERRRRFH
jgi:hypothetical protein